MKYLLQKDAEFWLEQLIRLGVYEKVETLTNGIYDKNENNSKKLNILVSNTTLLALAEEPFLGTLADVRSDVSEAGTISSSSLFNDFSDDKSENRFFFLNILKVG